MGTVSSLGRTVLAVVAGFLAMLVIAPGITALLRLVLPVARAAEPPTWYAIVDLTYSLAAIAAGGLVSALVARRWIAPVVLAAITLALGLITAVGGLDPAHPMWYTWNSAVLSPIAVLIGGRLVLRPGPARGVQPAGRI